MSDMSGSAIQLKDYFTPAAGAAPDTMKKSRRYSRP